MIQPQHNTQRRAIHYFDNQPSILSHTCQQATTDWESPTVMYKLPEWSFCEQILSAVIPSWLENAYSCLLLHVLRDFSEVK